MWELVRRQHGVIARWQLLALGYSPKAIRHRVAKGRLHPLWPGVYAVGRREVSRLGMWMAAVLACGEGAALSHESAAQLWGIRPYRHGPIDVSVPAQRRPRARGIRTHRRAKPPHATEHEGIPVTSPVQTLIDSACGLDGTQLERAVNEADKLDLIDAEALRDEIATRTGEPGVKSLRELLDRPTFALTDSELEQRFARIARRAGLPKPLTQARVNGLTVDFYWPDLKLVVETDGLRYHRTPAQQARDRRRDQTHAAAGLATLRFTHAQVRYERDQVERTLRAVALRVSARAAPCRGS